MGFEVAALAAAVVKIVVPFVQKGAEVIADHLGDAAADGGASVAERLWKRVKSALTSADEGGVVEQVETRPEASGPLLETVLKEQLEQDPKLREDVQGLVNEVHAGRDVIQISGDGGVVSAGTISGGMVIGYAGQVGPPPVPPAPTEREGE